MLELAKATRGMRVMHLHHKRSARVVRPVKSRGVITIEWEDNKLAPFYDARPDLLEAIAHE